VVPTSKAQAELINITDIIVYGNERIETETIIRISDLKINKSYSSEQINEALLKLNSTKYFEFVDLKPSNAKLVITVSEFPTINSINFEGNYIIKDENLSKLIMTSDRQPLSYSKVERDAELVADAYSIKGRLNAQVIPKIIKKSDNRVDLVFEINEGDITEIEKISFIGNRNFSETRLRGIISTKQAGLFRNLISSDTYIEERIDYDKHLLQDFYLNKGFINFKVNSTSAEMTRSKDAFLLSFSISEGQKYTYGNIKINTSIPSINLNDINKLINIKEGTVYDKRELAKLIEEIDFYLAKFDNFVDINPIITPDDENLKINIDIQLLKSKKLFVERIDVIGNSTTLDEVIRLKFDFVEGDPFNKRSVQEAADRIRALGFFTSVNVNTQPGSTAQKVIIVVDLIEKATGSLGIGAGYNSSDGSVFTFNINERNFLGKGQTVDLNLSSSSIERQLTLGLEDPSFLGRNLLAGISFGRKTSTPYSIPLSIDNLFFAPKIQFPMGKNSNLSAIYRYDKDKIKYSSASIVTSPLISSDIGIKTKSAVILSYNLNKTNSLVKPTSGFKFEVKQEINGLGGDVEYLKSNLSMKRYTTFINDDIILSSDFNSGIITGSDAGITNRFNLGGDKLKGFRNYGIGPIDNTYNGSDTNGDPLGGKMFTAVNIEASFPIGVPQEYGVFGGVFIGAGSVWGLDNTQSTGTVDDSFKIRSAAGVSLFWDTVIGPLRFNFSRPIKREKYDVIENFRFTVDTRF
jgi:outer membrane protein insertion porin family